MTINRLIQEQRLHELVSVVVDEAHMLADPHRSSIISPVGILDAFCCSVLAGVACHAAVLSKKLSSASKLALHLSRSGY
jgi:hypothetical protein